MAFMTFLCLSGKVAATIIIFYQTFSQTRNQKTNRRSKSREENDDKVTHIYHNS